MIGKLRQMQTLKGGEELGEYGDKRCACMFSLVACLLIRTVAVEFRQTVAQFGWQRSVAPLPNGSVTSPR